MREIKFRAWIPRAKKMLAWEDTLILLGPYVIDHNAHFNTVLMQYTGLLDKNGKEIYEGDIVEAWMDFGPAGEQQVIQTVSTNAWGCGLEEWTYKEPNRLPEVIGNIHENPELLKDK